MLQEEKQTGSTPLDEIMAFIHSTSWKGSKLGLSRIVELLELLGNPQKKLKFIHIAGTNGKGSTAAMIASVLQEAGYKTGLYTSPFIHEFGERMQINSIPVTNGELGDLVNQLRECTNRMQDSPTEFELITAMALLHFWQNQCDIVVLEVGMGGRLDATNVIDTPEVAVITPIGLDHTAELGDTLKKIAFEKAGIIKPGGNVVLAAQDLQVEGVIAQICVERAAVLLKTDNDSICLHRYDITGQHFDYGEHKNLYIPLLGEHQLDNVATVLKTIDLLQNRSWNIPDNAIYGGLSKVSWPGRFEVVSNNPMVIIDGAHNPQGVQALAANCADYFPGKKMVFVMGALADKDYRQMLRQTHHLAERYITVTPSNTRALNAQDLADTIKEEYRGSVTACDNPISGIRLAMEHASENNVVCAFGSLYILGEIRTYFR